MQKLLVAGVLALVGVAGSVGRAGAWEWGHFGPYAQTAAFPCANPPGWYTNTYSFPWYYPWFAYYNYSHGPYANWMAGGGYAYYGGRCGYPVYHLANWQAGCLNGACAPGAGAAPAPAGPPVKLPEPIPDPKPGKVTIHLPADAKLLFNGTAATGTGATRTFATPPLEPGREYGYTLTAEVVRDGRVQTVTELVTVRAGEKTSVTLTPSGVATASAK